MSKAEGRLAKRAQGLGKIFLQLDWRCGTGPPARILADIAVDGVRRLPCAQINKDRCAELPQIVRVNVIRDVAEGLGPERAEASLNPLDAARARFVFNEPRFGAVGALREFPNVNNGLYLTSWTTQPIVIMRKSHNPTGCHFS